MADIGAYHYADNTASVVGGRFCSFSPCIEQVQNTCLKLTDLEFTEIKTVECLLRQFDIRTCTISKPDMGPLEDLSYVKKSGGIPGLLTREDNSYICKSAVPPTQQPGHTGFLTFATLYPKLSE